MCQSRVLIDALKKLGFGSPKTYKSDEYKARLSHYPPPPDWVAKAD